MALKKNPGPPLTTVVRSVLDLIPARFRAKTQTIVAQQNPVDVDASAISGSTITSSVEQTRTDERLKKDISLAQLTDAQVSTQKGEWGLETVTDQLVADSVTAVDAEGTKEAQVALIGGETALAVKRLVSYPTPDGTTGLITAHTPLQEQARETGVVTDMLRDLVTASKAAAYAVTKRAAGYIVNIEDSDTKHKIITSAKARTADYDAYSRVMPLTVDLSNDLPDVLTTCAVAFDLSGDNGTYSEAGVTSGNDCGVTARGEAHSSATVTTRLLYTIDRTPAPSVPAIQYEILLPNPATATQVKTRLAAVIGGGPTINDWPKFRAKALNFTLRSEKVGLTARANSQSEQRLSVIDETTVIGTGLSGGTGSSVDYSPSINQIDIPPTIHAAFNLINTSNTKTVTAAANASQSGSFAVINADTGTLSITATGTISPSGTGAVAATTISAIPTTGLYLYKCLPQNYKDGYLMFLCIVVNMADV